MLYPDFKELIALGAQAGEPLGSRGRPVAAAASGDYASLSHGQGLSFAEVRRYAFGDDIRHIDWRVTARTGAPHLKIFTQERERSVLIAIDAGAHMRFGTRGTFKSVQAARAAAFVGWSASKGNDRVGGLVFGDVAGGMQSFKPARSRRALWKTLKLLSVPPQPAVSVPLAAALATLERMAATGALVFLISDFLDLNEDFEPKLARLQRRCDVVLLRIGDPADATLPALGWMEFSAASGKKARIDTDNRSGGNAYGEQWRQARQALEVIARRRQAGLIDLTTTDAVATTLALRLRRLGLQWGTR